MKTIDKVLIPFLSLVFMGLVGASYYIYTLIPTMQMITTPKTKGRYLHESDFLQTVYRSLF